MNPRSIGAWCSLLLTLLACDRFAMAETAGCKANDIHRVPVPIDYNDPAGPTFELAFRLRPGVAYDGPLVIALLGGAEGTLIGDDADLKSAGTPKNYSVALIDPRGTGCNDAPALTADHHFRPEWLARDTLRIVSSIEEANGAAPLNYILYGRSYGTVEATIAANLASTLNVTAPKAVVLERTLGQSFQRYADNFILFRMEWRALRSRLPRSWQTVVTEGKLVACGELYGDVHLLRDRKSGELIMPGESLCKGQGGGRRLDRFNSANWPVTMPLIYLQDEHDPGTPLSQALYHFERQTQAQRYFVKIERPARAMYGALFNDGDCRKSLWNAIVDDPTRLAAAVARCGALESEAHTALEYRPREINPATAREATELAPRSDLISSR
jgi:pimeloyl-ACP methyl ester carboxylesterase